MQPASRSVPECSDSERTPTEPLCSPTKSFSTVRIPLVSTESRAAFSLCRVVSDIIYAPYRLRIPNSCLLLSYANGCPKSAPGDYTYSSLRALTFVYRSSKGCRSLSAFGNLFIEALVIRIAQQLIKLFAGLHSVEQALLCTGLLQRMQRLASRVHHHAKGRHGEDHHRIAHLGKLLCAQIGRFAELRHVGHEGS